METLPSGGMSEMRVAVTGDGVVQRGLRCPPVPAVQGRSPGVSKTDTPSGRWAVCGGRGDRPVAGVRSDQCSRLAGDF